MQGKPKNLVIGSANMDVVMQSEHFPVPGETIIGGEFSTYTWKKLGQSGGSCSRPLRGCLFFYQ